MYRCLLIKQQSFLVIVSHNFGIQFWLGSVGLVRHSGCLLCLLTDHGSLKRLNASSHTCLVVDAGCEQRSKLSCGQNTYMGCFQVAWPSSQCCAKLRNHRYHLSSSITVDSHKGPGRTANITHVGGKYCFGSLCKIFPPKYSLYCHLDLWCFVSFLLLFLLPRIPTVTKIVLISFFVMCVCVYTYSQFICLVCPSFSLWSKLGVGSKVLGN